MREAGQAQVKSGILQVGQLDAQQFVFPGCVFADLVVGQDQGATLGVRQVVQRHNRHLGQTELARCQQTAVTGDHVVLAVDQDRCAPAELTDAGRDLGHLCLRMLLGIAGIGDQRLDLAVLDVDGVHGDQK